MSVIVTFSLVLFQLDENFLQAILPVFEYVIFLSLFVMNSELSAQTRYLV